MNNYQQRFPPKYNSQSPPMLPSGNQMHHQRPPPFGPHEGYTHRPMHPSPRDGHPAQFSQFDLSMPPPFSHRLPVTGDGSSKPSFIPSRPNQPDLRMLPPPLPPMTSNMRYNTGPAQYSEPNRTHIQPNMNLPPPKPNYIQRNHTSLQEMKTHAMNMNGSRPDNRQFISTNQSSGNYQSQSKGRFNPKGASDGDEEQMKDSIWVSNWLLRKQKNCRNDNRHGSTEQIFVAKQLLRKWITLLNDLELQNPSLNHSEDNQRDVNEKVTQLSALMQEFGHSINQPSLKKAIRRQQKKRESRKRRQKELYDDAQKEVEQRLEKHRKINEMQENVIKKDREIKRAKEMKEEADKILGQVRRKKTEADRVMDLLQNLKKLRQLRKERASQQGLYPPIESDKQFDSKLKHYGKLMKKQRLTYEDEENTLKVMLETEVVETEKKESFKAAKRDEAEFRNWQKQVTSLLFGHKTAGPEDPIFPFQQYYKQAENDFPSFLNIRSEWDMYLVPPGTPGGSSIPSNWVLPNMEKPNASAEQT